MEDRTFDTFAKALAQGRNRRTMLKGLLGIGGAVAAGSMLDKEADAARRGFSGPKQPTPVSPAPTCDPNTCYGCNSCINGVCVGDPTDCYVHECEASVCDPDGGCSYPFDCRQGTSCCGAHQICNTSTGQCECNPLDKCCNVQCSGCLGCVDGACVPDNDNCYQVPTCFSNLCQPDGGCQEFVDCRTGTGTECCGESYTCLPDGQCSQ